MIDKVMEILVIVLLVFTPIAFGSQVLWAFSLMELGVLLIIILWAAKRLRYRHPNPVPRTNPYSEIRNPKSEIARANNHVLIPGVLLSLFLGIVLLQIIPLPAGIIRIISPKTYELRSQLSVPRSGLQIRDPKSPFPSTNPKSEFGNPKSEITTLSFFPLATKIELLKWLTLAGLFIFLLRWRLPDNAYHLTTHLIICIFLVGVFESLYGIFEFFSGHQHILGQDFSNLIRSVQGTFINRNYFAGYLLMVIPLSVGLLFSRERSHSGRFRNWRHRLASLDGKSLLVGFGLILMILGLLLSASRVGILCLLISFTLISLFFRGVRREQGLSRIPALACGLGVVWAAWIGLDAVISRFFAIPEHLKSLWLFWVNTYGIFRDFPILGSGLGTFTEVFSMYRSFHIWELATHAENDFLQLASEVGLLGVAPLLVLFFYLFFKAGLGIRSLSRDAPERYVAIGGLVGILALMLHSFVERNIQVPANAFLYTVMWAIVLRNTAEPQSSGEGRAYNQGEGTV